MAVPTIKLDRNGFFIGLGYGIMDMKGGHYNMEWEDYQAKLQQINNPDTDAETRAMLYTEITEDYSNQLATIQETNERLTRIKETNDKLVKANTHLTLSVGDSFAPPSHVVEQEKKNELKGLTLEQLLERKRAK